MRELDIRRTASTGQFSPMSVECRQTFQRTRVALAALKVIFDQIAVIRSDFRGDYAGRLSKKANKPQLTLKSMSYL